MSSADTSTPAAFSGYLEFSRKRYRLIPKSKTWINKNTPVGEPAEYYEKKPYGGRREFQPLLEIKDWQVISTWGERHNWEKKRWEFKMPKDMRDFLEGKGVWIPDCVGHTAILREGELL